MATAFAKVIPAKVAAVFSIAFGYAPVFTSSLSEIIDAYEARGRKIRHRSPIRKFFAILSILLTVLFSAIQRAQMMSLALECKGFGSTKRRTYRKKLIFTRADYTAIAVLSFIFLVAGINLLHELIPDYYLTEVFLLRYFPHMVRVQ